MRKGRGENSHRVERDRRSEGKKKPEQGKSGLLSQRQVVLTAAGEGRRKGKEGQKEEEEEEGCLGLSSGEEP
ncbi:hypothetical protein E2C01_084039 [Portunus trituberculatus]|uniref:Uncharacterized protein n=1 Tax=Portunus trituberculatus TaxID=210409 RepID=A0A5B7J588_PORTR|nr:hypothetical protein [Portunus trituberculatus]